MAERLNTGRRLRNHFSEGIIERRIVTFADRKRWSILIVAILISTSAAIAQHDQISEGLVSGSESSLAANVVRDVTVTDAQMHSPDPDNWLLNGRTYDNQRFSPLVDITRDNVKQLRPAAIIQTGVMAAMEMTPIVVNGVMYAVTAGDHVRAYDAVVGHVMWSYDPVIAYTSLCCGPQSRGVAVAYGKVYVARADGIVVALDARTGKQIWKSDRLATLPSDSTHYSYTSAPVAYDGMVIIGSAGGEWPIRGFVQAYDADNGKLIWRFRTTAAPDQLGGKTWSGDSWKYGGGAVWNTVAVDTKNDIILFGTGNPNPDVWDEDRKGDNAYTDSIVAIQAKNGKLAWWYQVVPHDLWDYDQGAPVTLFDADDGHGRSVLAAVEAGKTGDAVIVNRITGKLLRKVPIVEHSANMFTAPSELPITIYPGAFGGNAWSPGAFSPLTRYFYTQSNNVAYTYSRAKDYRNDPSKPQIGMNLGGVMKMELDGPNKTIEPYGSLTAIDVNLGKIAWQYRSPIFMQSGVLATASNLVFAGEGTGDVIALDAKTGEKLWNFYLGVPVRSSPIAYKVGDKEYIAVAAGGGEAQTMRRLGRTGFGNVIAIFALP